LDQEFIDYLENGRITYDVFVNPNVDPPATKVDSNNKNIRAFLGGANGGAGPGSPAGNTNSTPGALEVTTVDAQRAAAEQALAAEKEKVRQLEAKIKELEAKAGGGAAPTAGGPSAKEQQLEAEVTKLKADLASAPQSSACTIL